ncbi:Fic/DOC family protein [Corynebacterium auriscanis]|uniref:Fic/DOC family protein n=1 Tax=Corynebacterium auriscanis TaxID=99807 RepID=UPI003CF9B6D3
MAKPADVWTSYFYPGTQVLRNIPDIQDQDTLQAVEYLNGASAELSNSIGESSLEGGDAGSRLCSAHNLAFGALYEWAGALRKVNIQKGGHHFGDHASMGMYLRHIGRAIENFEWESTDFNGTLRYLAKIHTDLNFAHPFREGNGRATKIFMTDLARQHGVELAFCEVDANTWNQASRDSFMDPYGLYLNYEPMLDVYKSIAMPKQPGEVSSHAQRPNH